MPINRRYMDVPYEIETDVKKSEAYIVCTIDATTKIASTQMSSMTYDQFMIMFKNLDDAFGRFVQARQLGKGGPEEMGASPL